MLESADCPRSLIMFLVQLALDSGPGSKSTELLSAPHSCLWLARLYVSLSHPADEKPIRCFHLPLIVCFKYLFQCAMFLVVQESAQTQLDSLTLGTAITKRPGIKLEVRWKECNSLVMPDLK